MTNMEDNFIKIFIVCFMILLFGWALGFFTGKPHGQVSGLREIDAKTIIELRQRNSELGKNRDVLKKFGEVAVRWDTTGTLANEARKMGLVK